MAGARRPGPAGNPDPESGGSALAAARAAFSRWLGRVLPRAPCRHCGGTGMGAVGQPCPQCGGRGRS
ncbi:MAG TPA: hypothetical protein VHU81_09080 [Thermoanaerobaculia bacterium]|nr:hypothetical protein [Thermoanaerobaculia bacterium]